MADVKQPTATGIKAPQAKPMATAGAPGTSNQAPTTAPQAPPGTQGAGGEAPKKEKRKKAVYQSVFDSAEAAQAEANSREKGPRRAFQVTYGDTTVFCVAHNEGRAGGIGFEKIGGEVVELGKSRKSKPVGVDGILAAIESLPEADRESVKAALAKLAAGK